MKGEVGKRKASIEIARTRSLLVQAARLSTLAHQRVESRLQAQRDKSL
jgi:hypothetical protein